MTLKQLQDICQTRLYTLIGEGALVCREFQTDNLEPSQCQTCNYSRYWHLIKEIAEAAE